MFVVALTTHMDFLRFVCEPSPGTEAATLVHCRPINATIMKHITIRTTHDGCLFSTFLPVTTDSIVSLAQILRLPQFQAKQKWRATRGSLLRRRSSNNLNICYTQEKRVSLEVPFRIKAVAGLLQLQLCCSESCNRAYTAPSTVN